MAHLQKTVGTVSQMYPSRTFVDGIYCRRVEFADSAGKHHEITKVFITSKLASVVKPMASGEFYFWNSHCYAFASDQAVVEDIDGARTSYFKRDMRLLLLLALSIVLIPYVLFVIGKKLAKGGSRRQMESFISASRDSGS